MAPLPTPMSTVIVCLMITNIGLQPAADLRWDSMGTCLEPHLKGTHVKKLRDPFLFNSFLEKRPVCAKMSTF